MGKRGGDRKFTDCDDAGLCRCRGDRDIPMGKEEEGTGWGV